MRVRLICAAAAFLALAACGSAKKEEPTEMSPEDVADEMSGLKMNPGMWEITNEILSATAPGISQDKFKGMVGKRPPLRSCITPEQAAKPSPSFMAAMEKSDCTYQQWSVENGRMMGAMSCSGGNLPTDMNIKLSGTYAPDSYSLDMDITTEGVPGGPAVVMKATTRAKRVGECV
jgi:hypothetical protein